MKRKRTIRAAIAAGILAVTAAVLFLALSRPAPPPTWMRIKKGMPRDEVTALLGPPSGEMVELKGYDLWMQNYSTPPSWHQLHVHYGGIDEVLEASLHFVDPSNGLRNQVRQLIPEDDR